MKICPKCKSSDVIGMNSNTGGVYWLCNKCLYKSPIFLDIEVVSKKLKNQVK